MDRNEQLRQQRQIYDRQRRQFYDENPDVAGWVKTKKVIRNIILAYWVLHTVLTVVFLLQTGQTGSIWLEIAKLLFQMLWIFVFINPEGSWRFSLILYLWALGNFGMMLQYGSDIMNSLAYIAYNPLYGAMLVMETMVPFLFLVVAVYLTAFPKHRTLSDRAYEFRKQAAEEINKIMR